MEAIIFVGLQASGKSTFYKNNFFNSHVRISNDLLKTKHREKLILEFCKQSETSFVVDNTNPSKDTRKKYIDFCKDFKCTIKCYYFKIDLPRSLEWNDGRLGKEKIPTVGILGTHKKIEIPSADEGFDELFYVDYINQALIVKEWKNEI